MTIVRPTRLIAATMLISLFLAALSYAERLPVRYYTTSDGLGSSAINAIVNDSRGFLWFATRDGLSRFDGFRFNTYKITDDNVAETIAHLIERKNGDYIVAVQGKGVYRFNASTPVVESSKDGLFTIKAERILNKVGNRLFEDRDGIVWMIDDGKLFRVGEGDGRFAVGDPLPIEFNGNRDISIFHYYEDQSGTFWLTTNLGLLRTTKDGRTLSLYATPPPTAMRTFLIYLFADRAGRIWIQSQNGFFVMKPDTPGEADAPIVRPLTANISGRLPDQSGEIVQYTATDGLQGTVVPSLHQSADGRIWLASDQGLMVFDGKRFRKFDAANGMGEYLSSIVEDPHGNLWIGSLSGVYQIVINGLTTFTKDDGLGRTDIVAVYGGKSGEMHVVGGDWYVSRFDGNRFVSAKPNFGEDGGVPIWTSNLAYPDSFGSWWFLTEKKLFRYDGVSRIEQIAARRPNVTFATGEKFNNGAFYRVFEDSKGDLWTSMRSGDRDRVGLNLWNRTENRFRSFGEKEGFPPNASPSAFCEDESGNLWIGYYNGGLSRYRDGRFRNFTPEEGLPAGFVTSIFMDHAGRMWMATNENGLIRIDEPVSEHPVFTPIEGISSKNARTITEDAFGRIYVGTVRGVDRYTPNTNEMLHYSTADGLADDFVTSSYRGPNGEIWFGTRNGISRLIPTEDPPGGTPPILIAGLRVAGEKRPVSQFGERVVGRLDLRNSQNNLQVEFFSVGLASPKRIRFQYRLEGADTDWSQPTSERIVNYSNLAAGDYNFLVRAVTSEGLVSPEPASVLFSIAPPVWRTWWFTLLSVLLVVGVVYFVLNQRFKRFLELEKVRTRIATDLHDDIGASLSRISMLSEIVKRDDASANRESARRLTQIATEARGLVDSMSDIVWAINPRRDSIESVVDRVCSFAADTLGTRDVHWTVSAPPELSRVHLTAEEKRNLYLIFKEAVNNVARHSGCTNASLAIRLERGVMIAEIADNGVGFDAVSASTEKNLGGQGIENMSRRATEIGGTLEITSEPEKGTKVSLTMPIALSRTLGRFATR